MLNDNFAKNQHVSHTPQPTTYTKGIEEMFCDDLAKYVQLDGKRILDVGCGNGDLVKYIVGAYSPEYVIGIEPMLDAWWNTNESEGDRWKVVSGNAHNLDFDDNSFDVVVSFSTFEHIGDIKKALAEIKRVLKPRGKFYTEFMPIWTSAAGHHFVAKAEDWWNSEHIRLIPPWGHLYMSETEMREHLISQLAERSLIDEMIEFIYHSDWINRYSRYELLQCIANSAMLIRHYEERVSFNRLGFIAGEKESELSQEIIDRVSGNAQYKISDLGVAGMRVCLEKYEAI